MTNICWTRRLKQAAWIGFLGLAVFAVVAPGSARAQDDEDSIWNLNERLMKNFMGALGLKNGSEDEIDYRERSPLVVPPNRDLPPPEANATAHGPAWPVDPDQKRRREARTKTRTYLTGTSEDSRPLSPSELNPPSVQDARRRGGRGAEVSSGGNEKQMLPSELGYVGGLFSWKSLGFNGQKDEVGTFKQEPPRASLSEPPTGYQTPSPAEPYGVTKRDERTVTPYDPAVGSRP
jgi:hypothetical protein